MDLIYSVYDHEHERELTVFTFETVPVRGMWEIILFVDHRRVGQVYVRHISEVCHTIDHYGRILHVRA